LKLEIGARVRDAVGVPPADRINWGSIFVTFAGGRVLRIFENSTDMGSTGALFATSGFTGVACAGAALSTRALWVAAVFPRVNVAV
jgi:hypothetical protein